jgi:hypothetical protein
MERIGRNFSALLREKWEKYKSINRSNISLVEFSERLAAANSLGDDIMNLMIEEELQNKKNLNKLREL